MSESKSNVDLMTKIQGAACIEFDEILIKNLKELVEYRKKIAQSRFSCPNEENYEYLTKLYERSEYYIKALLFL